MSVILAHRDLSKMEFYKNGLELRKLVLEWLLTDFAMKPYKKDIKVLERNLPQEDIDTMNEIIERNDINHDKFVRKTAPQWFTDEEKQYLSKLTREMMANIVKANSIYVGHNMNPHDYELRRTYQTKAIADVQAILEEIHEICDIYPHDMNKMIRMLECADKEFDLLKGWRKSENKYYKGENEG